MLEGPGDHQNPLRVGYYDPFNCFPIIEKELCGKFPLTNLHWKYDVTRPIKSIPILPIKLVEDVPKKRTAISKSDSHYLKLMFIKCDNMDTYRSQVRPLIKEWLKNTVLSVHSEWMILLVIPSTSKDKHSTLMKLSIYDKLKIDFGIDGKELPPELSNRSSRLFKVKEKFDDDSSKLDTYGSIISQIKELLLKIFTASFTELQKRVQMNTSQLKEKIAVLLKLAELLFDMRLYDDSLKYFKRLSTSVEEYVSSEPGKIEIGINPNSINFTNDQNFENFEESMKLDQVRNALLDSKRLENISLFELKSFLFIRQSNLLQSLATQGKSISVSSSYIASLYQNLLVFLNEISLNTSSNQDSKSELSDWSFMVIETYLNLPITKYLFEKVHSSDESSQNNQVHPLHEVIECMGELKLFQRTILVYLGSTRGYVLNRANTLEEISLTSDSDKGELNVKDIQFLPLSNALTTEETFLDSFQRITESVIQDFVVSERGKSIDILSIDIALVKFYQQKYDEALQILEGSSEFFIESGWNYMGGILLETYLKCIEETHPSGDSTDERNELISTTCLKLLSNLKTGKIESSTGINDYNLFKTSDNILQLFQKVYKYSNLLVDTHLEYDVNKIFDIHISPYISNDQKQVDSDCYYIDIEVFNTFGVEVQVQGVSFELKNEFDDVLNFDIGECTISPVSKKLRLLSHSFIFGTFSTSKLSISLDKNLKLIKHFEKAKTGDKNEISDMSITGARSEHEYQEGTDDSVVHYSEWNPKAMLTMFDMMDPNLYPTSNQSLDSSFRMFSFPRIKNVRFEFINPLTIELGKTDVVLRLYGGNSDAQNLEISISTLTPGVNIRHEMISILGSSNEDLRFSTSNTAVTLSKLQKNSVVDLRIPYVYFSDNNKLIKLKAVVLYQIKDIQFSHASANTVDTTLTISVSVQDIFKLEHIFSKFQVGTSNPRYPIRIMSNKLSSPEGSKYKILSPLVETGSIVAFGDQAANFFYKIFPNPSHIVKNSPNDFLDLVIEYHDLKDEISQIFEAITLTKLRSVDLESYWLLFKNLVLDRISFNLNSFALQDKIVIENGDILLLLTYRIIERYIPDSTDKLMLKRIFEQLLKNDELTLNSQSERTEHKEIESRTLSIQVPIPHLRILHIIEFDYDKKPQMIVGEPIEVRLSIHPTRKWSKNPSKSSEISLYAESSPKASNTNQLGEVNAKENFQINFIPDDNWLISGFRRTSFEVDYSEKEVAALELQIVLIPLNVGKLLLPKLEVKSLDFDSSREDMLMDIVLKNGFESVLVVPELDSITFSF